MVIRRKGGVRGSCTGHLRAFDRHMNMILHDVEDEYTVSEIEYRKAKHANPTLQGQSRGNRKRALFVQRGHTRHLPQLFIKGDCVVMVIMVS